jgi:hypothetical protein
MHARILILKQGLVNIVQMEILYLDINVLPNTLTHNFVMYMMAMGNVFIVNKDLQVYKEFVIPHHKFKKFMQDKLLKLEEFLNHQVQLQIVQMHQLPTTQL